MLTGEQHLYEAISLNVKKLRIHYSTDMVLKFQKAEKAMIEVKYELKISRVNKK